MTGTSSEGTAETLSHVPLEQWEGCRANELAAVWQVPEVRLFRSVGSTNDVARELAAAGAPTGTVVLAEEQRRGRGRAGRAWSSDPGLGLWLSMILRPPAERLAALPIAVGLQVARALDPWAVHSPVMMKWPNDLLIGDRKLAGILCEASWAGGRSDHVIVGIGMNLLHAPDDFPPELRTTATSLAAATGKPVSRYEVATGVVEAVLAASSYGFSLAEAEARDALRQKHLEVREPETGSLIASGLGAGITDDGELLVSSAASVRRVRSGTVRLV